MSFPYTHYSCPCTNISAPARGLDGDEKPTSPAGDTQEDDDTTFDPHNPRADFALYPIENLLFCNECHEIRCPRCYFEEVLYYFCPQCLFEVPSTTVKTETNRCQRSCFQCPICIAPLQLQAFAPADEQRALKPDQPASRDGPFILSCSFCAWSTLEIGIKFEKSVNISSQLARTKNGGQPVKSLTDPRQSLPPDTTITDEDAPPTDDDDTRNNEPDNDAEHFARLAAFYKSELTDASASSGLASSLGLDSPSHLSRLLTTYGVSGLKRHRNKPMPMREAATALDGLTSEPDDDDALVSALSSAGWAGTTTPSQRAQQTDTPAPCLTSSARPIPMPLRSKRAKRCRACRHNLIRPDDKRQSTKFKIRLLAANFVPRVSVAPLDPALPLAALPVGRTAQFLLTLRNPLFDPVKIHLATPGTAPGPAGSRVTILCPTFDIGASADVWDEALASGDRDKRRTRDLDAGEGGAPEAGKVWERGRNWSSVIVEVVPGSGAAGKNANADADAALQVPVLVRLEYYTDQSGSDLPSSPESPTYKSTQEERVPRELSFWVVLGLGRIRSLG